MGTYGVTHVKKDNKIVPFTDSHDGYFSGMGYSNLLCIKYLSTPIISKIFDKFNITEKIDEETTKDDKYRSDLRNNAEGKEITQRDKDNALYLVEQDTQSTDALEWMKDTLSHGLRASISGFAPLLYLNINPHYNLNYNSCSYLVDIEQEKFVCGKKSLDFSKIREASELQLRAFSEGVTNILSKETQEKLKKAKNKNSDLFIVKNFDIFDEYLKVNDDKIKAYYEKVEKEWEKNRLRSEKEWEEKYGNRTNKKEEKEGSFIIYSANMDIVKLRSVLAVVQNLSIKFRECEFLTDHMQWGLDQDFNGFTKSGGFILYEPQGNDELKNKIFNEFVNSLKTDLNINLNSKTYAGQWSAEAYKAQEEINKAQMFLFNKQDFFPSDDFQGPPKPQLSQEERFEKMEELQKLVEEREKLGIPGPKKTIYSIEKFYENGWGEDFKTFEPYISVHTYYRDVRDKLLDKNANIVHSVDWTSMAIIHQDKEVFDKVYLLAKEKIFTLSEHEKYAAYGELLTSITSMEKVHAINNQFAHLLNKELEPDNNQDFISYLQKNKLFRDAEPFMTDLEKVMFSKFNESSGTKMKM
jgi:hypothetical protein